MNLSASTFQESSAASGGCIAAWDSELKVTDSTFEENSAKTSGGVLYLYQASRGDVEKSRFTHSTAPIGGSIYIEDSSELSIRSTVFSNSSALFGGCIAARDSELNVTDSTFEENTAKISGGVLFLYQASRVDVRDSQFRTNSATRGGSVYCDASIVSIRLSNFFDNTATYGAAVMARNKSSIAVEKSSFSNNAAEKEGGVMDVDDECEVDVRDCLFRANVAHYGGCLDASSSVLTIHNVTFLANMARSNAGVLNVNDESGVDIQSCRFEKNLADRSGGVMHLSRESWATFVRCAFRNNSASDGGLVYSRDASNVTVTQSNVTDSSARRGGGAFYSSHCRVIVKNCSLVNGFALHGGVVNAFSSLVMIKGCKLAGNEAVYGGSLYTQISSVEVEDCDVVGNSGKHGGAFYGVNSTLSIATTTFEANSADYGGALHVTEDSWVTMSSSRLSRNGAFYGGAVFADEAGLDFQTVTFQDHCASEAGGAICLTGKTSALRMTGSMLRRNSVVSPSELHRCRLDAAVAGALKAIEVNPDSAEKKYAIEGGGAVAVGGSSSLVVAECRFEENSSNQGGALAVLFGHLDAAWKLRNCSFKRNRAVSGGALYATKGGTLETQGVKFIGNEAETGGAMCLEKRATVKTTAHDGHSLFFKNNRASQGGGVYCRNCTLHFGHVVEFVENHADEFGGGAAFVASGSNVSVLHAMFERNTASSGGAIAARDCNVVELGRNGGYAGINFTRNSALLGGAVHLELNARSSAEYKVENCWFSHNAANESDDLALYNDNALSKWPGESNGALQAYKEDQPSACVNCSRGRGGALFIGLRNLHADANISVLLSHLQISDNKASIGGGGYTTCTWLDHEAERGCSLIVYEDVTIANNTATVTGGGLFVNALENIAPYHIGETHAPVKGTDRNNEVTDVHLENNQILEQYSGYGPDLATDASSLRVENVVGPLGPFRPGAQLGVSAEAGDDDDASLAVVGILVVVLDAMNQRVKGGSSDSDLEVVLNSDWISGKRRYNAEKGIVTISNTSVAGVDRKETLIIQSADGRDISASLTFVTERCSNGELKMESEAGCFRCANSQYSFRPNGDECRPCAEDGICDGTAALIPKNEFWHATPFSPVMRQCFVKEACSFEGRAEQLHACYKDVHNVSETFEAMNSTGAGLSDFLGNYNQCSSGHTGIVCGSCEDGYGHAADGKCVECNQSVAITRCLTAALLLLLFTVVTIKVYLGKKGVEEEAVLQLEEEKETTISTITHAAEDRPLLEAFRREKTQSPFEKRTLRRCRSERTIRPPDQSRNEVAVAVPVADEGPSENAPAHRANRPSALQRSQAIEDPTANPPSRNVQLRIKAMKASGALTDTYNIAYNYVQLNAAALCLDVYWNGALQNLLAVQTLMGRVIGVKFLPFDCNFGDRDDDVGVPNALAALWMRVCFPVATIGVYMLAIYVCKAIRPKRRRSRYTVDTLPRARLVALMVYLASCIDMFGHLLKALHCVKLEPVDPEHPYAEYEILEATTVWTGDTSLTCWEGTHLRSAVAAAIGLALCGLTFVFMMWILWKGRSTNKLEDPNFLLQYGVLYLGYRQAGPALYWEVVLTARRIAIAFISEFANDGDLQIGLASMTIFAFVVLHQIVKPFDNTHSRDTFPAYAGSSFRIVGANCLADQWVDFNQYVSLNGLESTSLLMSLSLFWTAASISGQEGHKNEINALLSICFVLNALFSVFMLYRLWYCLHHFLDVVACERGILFKQNRTSGQEDGNTYLLFKLWVIIRHWKKFGMLTVDSVET